MLLVMLLVPLPWAARTWALPVLTALAPSERYARTHHRRHKTLQDWARQLWLVVRRGWPDRPLVAVAESTYATLPLLARCQGLPTPITFISRPRLDARWTSLPRRGTRTASDVRTAQASGCRPWPAWRMTQPRSAPSSASRSGMAVASARWRSPRPPPSGTTRASPRCRCTGCSSVSRSTRSRPRRSCVRTCLADQPLSRSPVAILLPTWSRKDHLSFAGALALVRRERWASQSVCLSSATTDTVKVPRVLIEHLTDTLCYAA
jgi:hypothetical protein